MVKPIETFQHSCHAPIGEVRGSWTCPVCDKHWTVSQNSAGSDARQDVAEIYSVTMLRPDGTHVTYKVRD